MDVLASALKGLRFALKTGGKSSKKNLVTPIEHTEFDYVATPKSDRFTLGYSSASILPPDVLKKTYYIAGYQGNKPAKGVLDEPCAHAVWLDDGSGHGGIVLVSLDAVGMLNYDVNIIRNRLKDFAMLTGCRSINIVSTHNHPGIDTMGIWGPLPISGKNPKYMKLIGDTVVRCVECAYASRQKGHLYKGTVEVEDMQEDIRLPIVYSKTLTRLRFVPENGSRETWILNFASHSESLQGCNERVSADFPAYLRERIAEKAGAQVLYCVGCIGGMISMEIPDEREIRDTTNDFAESTKRIGYRLADYALDIKDETELRPRISFIRREFYFDVDNTVLMIAAKAGILKATEYHNPEAPLSHCMKSEMSYFEIDTHKVLMLPGELFPELAYGGYLSADECATGFAPEGINPTPLTKIAGEDIMFIGLANDEVGYILPPNDYLLDEKSPYAETPRDRLDRRHYEETNSLGPKTAVKIADEFKEILAAVEKAKNP